MAALVKDRVAGRNEDYCLRVRREMEEKRSVLGWVNFFRQSSFTAIRQVSEVGILEPTADPVTGVPQASAVTLRLNT